MSMMPRWRDRSINQRVPLLIAIVLVVTVAALSGTAYARLRATLLSAAGVRLQLASQPVARSLSVAIRRQTAAMQGMARDNGVTAVIAAGRATTAPKALAPLVMDTAAPAGHVELRDAAGHRVFIDKAARSSEATPWVDSLVAAGRLKPGQVVVSPVQDVGGSLFADMVAAVGAPDDTARLFGYLIEHAPIVGRGVGDIRDLIGAGTVVMIGTPDSGVWTDLSTAVPPPPVAFRLGRPTVFRSSPRGPGVGAATAIAGTPWVLWVQQPWSTALAPMAGFARTLASLALFFVLAGAAVAWWLSRRITRPLTALTRAAQAIATNGVAPASDDTGDEVQQLSTAFMRMEDRVAQSHAELEVRVEQRTRELEDALGRLREAQEKLVLQERLAVLGRLAGAVGHELRNPLGVMTNALFVLEAAIPEPPAMVTEYLGILRGQVGMAERIVGDLLDTARTRSPQVSAVPLGPLIETQLQRMGPMQSVVVQRRFPDGIPAAWADPAQVSQIVLNLMTNAVQAMGEQGGTLTISGRTEAGGRVLLNVTDTGPGISDDLRERIFEPLFTTKARGLGLGLWVSRTLAEANGGQLRVTSAVEAGTTFTLDLPAALEEAVV